MHWSYFIGSYTILSPTSKKNNIIITGVIEKFGNKNFRKFQEDMIIFQDQNLFLKVPGKK